MRFALAVLGAVFAVMGCAGDEESAPPRAAGSDQVEAPAGDLKRTDEVRSEVPRTDTGARKSQPEQAPGKGRKRIEMPSGAVTITPERPRTHATRPGRGCVIKELSLRTGGSKRFAFPPRPGIAAERVDEDAVSVAYDLGAVDPRCRPVWLKLTLDVNDDGQSGATTNARIREPQGEITLEVTDGVRGADVLIASVRTSDGRPSEPSRILIQQ
jgi:hypothetical protein